VKGGGRKGGDGGWGEGGEGGGGEWGGGGGGGAGAKGLGNRNAMREAQSPRERAASVRSFNVGGGGSAYQNKDTKPRNWGTCGNCETVGRGKTGAAQFQERRVRKKQNTCKTAVRSQSQPVKVGETRNPLL